MALTYNAVTEVLTFSGNTHTDSPAAFAKDQAEGWGVITNPETDHYIYDVKRIVYQEATTFLDQGTDGVARTITFPHKNLGHNTKKIEVFNNNNETSVQFDNCNIICKEQLDGVHQYRYWLFYDYEGGLNFDNCKVSGYIDDYCKVQIHYYASARTGNIRECQFTGITPGRCAMRNTIFDGAYGADTLTGIAELTQSSFDNVVFTGCPSGEYVFSIYGSTETVKMEPSNIKAFDNDGDTFGVNASVEGGNIDAKFTDCVFDNWSIIDLTTEGRTPVGIKERYTYDRILTWVSGNVIESGTISCWDNTDTLQFEEIVTNGRFTSQKLVSVRHGIETGSQVDTSKNPHKFELIVGDDTWEWYEDVEVKIDEIPTVIFYPTSGLAGGKKVKVSIKAPQRAIAKDTKAVVGTRGQVAKVGVSTSQSKTTPTVSKTIVNVK